MNFPLKNSKNSPHMAKRACCNLCPKNCPPLKVREERKIYHKKSQPRCTNIKTITPINPNWYAPLSNIAPTVLHHIKK